MSSTTRFDAIDRPGLKLSIPVAAATLLLTGALGAVDAAGRAVAAANTAGLRVIGRIEEDADNSAGAAGDINATIKRGVFRYKNSAVNAVTQAYIGKQVYVEDDVTVATTSTNKVIAGRVIEVTADGVFIDTRDGAQEAPVQVTLTSTNGTAGAAADLPALKAEAEHIGDDLRAMHAALVSKGILLP